MLTGLRRLGTIWQLLSLLAALGLGLGTLWGLYAYVRQQGYAAGDADATARCQAEKAAQQKANQTAIEAGARQLLRLADQLSSTNQEMDDAVASALAAAAADPTGARECLPLGSVRRVAPIR